jgi:anti-sigma B factor antagonist
MELSTKTENPIPIVSANDDRIDAAVAIEFKDAMRTETLDETKIVVLDLSAVNFIDQAAWVPLSPQ